MPKYTPGPWKRQHSAIVGPKTDEDGDPIVVAVPFGVNQRNYPRGLDTYSVPPKDEAEGNSSLINAAPQLYEALKAWIEYEDGASLLNWDDVKKLVDGAIAKAEGK